MYSEKYLDNFIRCFDDSELKEIASKIYSAEEIFLLRQYLSKPLQPTFKECVNLKIEKLYILTHTMINPNVRDGELLANCFFQAREIYENLFPCKKSSTSGRLMDYKCAPLLYEIERLLASPYNLIAVRLLNPAACLIIKDHRHKAK